MKLPELALLEPADLQEASAMLAAHAGNARVLAGGTDLLVKMKQRRQLPEVLVDIKRIAGLRGLEFEPGNGARIGALVTMEELKNAPWMRRHYPMLHDAVSRVGTIEIRNCATLAGNVCNASPAAETIAALTLLGAQLVVADDSARWTAPMEAFVTGPGRTALRPSQLVQEIRLPKPQRGCSGAYDKFSLRQMDLAVVGVAATVALDDGICSEARVMLSSVAPVAMRARAAEAVLVGRTPDDASIDEAARAAASQAQPRDDLFGTVAQKRNMVAVLTARVLRRALERSRSTVPA